MSSVIIFSAARSGSCQDRMTAAVPIVVTEGVIPADPVEQGVHMPDRHMVPPRRLLDPQVRLGQVFAHVHLHHAEQHPSGPSPPGTEGVTSRNAIASRSIAACPASSRCPTVRSSAISNSPPR